MAWIGLYRPDFDEIQSVAREFNLHKLAVEVRTLTEASLAQSEEVKKISAWAAILFAPTLVGTICGMNFKHMPELGWLYGYPAALGLMITTSTILYLVFKKRRWL